jgi:hypothetical protein
MIHAKEEIDLTQATLGLQNLVAQIEAYMRSD